MESKNKPLQQFDKTVPVAVVKPETKVAQPKQEPVDNGSINANRSFAVY